MRDWKKILGGLAMACLLAACQTDDWREARGGIRVSLGEASVGVETKSTPEDLGEPLTTEFNVRVVKEGGSEIYNGKFPDETIPASAGTYTVTASYGENADIAWDAPYYEGTTEEPVVVKDGETATATVTCKVANALFSATFPPAEEMEKAYEAYGLKVTVGSTSMTFKPGETRHIYVKAGSAVKYAFAYTRLSGEEGEAPLTSDKLPTAPEAGTHYTINLTMDDKLGLDISKVEAEEVSISETIPLEWLPAPKVSATGFTNNVLDVYETATPTAASIDFEVNQMYGLEDLEFAIDFKDENLRALTGTYTLSTLTDGDRAKFADAGITLPTISQTSPKISFSTDFIGKLRAVDNGVVANTITINQVMANNRPNKDKSPVVYTINTHKPEFTVAVPEGNVWSKTFTAEEITVAEGKGDLETIKKVLVYQYQDADGTWKDFSDQPKREQAFSDHPEKKDYKVRAFYRGALASNVVDVTLEDPTPVPNGDMEAWTDDFVTYSYWAFGTYTFNQPLALPWQNSQQWWDTNNYQTLPEELPTIGEVSYKCFPTTTYLMPGYGGTGKSAVMRTVNANGGASSSVSARGTNYRGILYAGYTDRDGTMHEGREWHSRPTHLSFVYNYESLNNERFGIYVEIYSDNTQIGSGRYESTQGKSVSSFTPQSIALDYTNEALKATSIRLRFCSVAEGDNPKVDTKISVNVPEGSSDHYTIHGGSVLRIDDISLIYDK